MSLMGPGAQPVRLRKGAGLGGLGLKLALLGVFDALAIHLTVLVLGQGAWPLALFIALAALLINVAVLNARAYPLRYLLPGLLFMAVMIVYPLIYNVYVSFTNYGTGNILSREQVIEHLTAQTYADPSAPKFRFTAFADPEENVMVMLTAADGTPYVSQGNVMVPLDTVPDVVDEDGDGVIDRIGDAVRLQLRDIVRLRASIEQLRLDWDGVILELVDSSNFQARSPVYTWNAAEGTLTDNRSGVTYSPQDGYFTSPDGERLIPGFRTVVGWKNYVSLLTNPAVSGPFLRIFTWTFVWAGLSVVLTFSLGLGLALVLNNPHLKLKGLYRSLLIIPYAIPAFVSALVWRGLFHTEFGQVNRVLMALFGTQIPWLQDPFWAKVALLIVNLWLGYPYMMIITLGALQSIPPELYEAAYCDGARTWQSFRTITMPLLMTSVAPLLISSFAYNFNNFTVIYLLTRGRPPIPGAVTPAGSTDILISYTYRLAFEGGRGADYGLAAAVSVLIFLIVGTITWLNFRFTKALEEVAAGA